MSDGGRKLGPLQAEGLAVAYGDTTIVRQVNLDAAQGAFTVLLGPNGSGKSTLLRALAGMLPASKGRVLLDGRPISAYPTIEIARRIAVLPQGPSAPEGLTVRELVEQGRYPHRGLFGRWREADEAACERAMTLTGIAEHRDRPLDTLSGGQRQRAWIAMTLAQETGILLLDEPTTFLDLAHQLEVLDLLADIVRARHTTVVAVLHDLNMAARYADRLILLRQGAIVSDGPANAALTEANITDVFGVACKIIVDPVSGAPLCIPIANGRRGSSNSP